MARTSTMITTMRAHGGFDEVLARGVVVVVVGAVVVVVVVRTGRVEVEAGTVVLVVLVTGKVVDGAVVVTGSLVVVVVESATSRTTGDGGRTVRGATDGPAGHAGVAAAASRPVVRARTIPRPAGAGSGPRPRAAHHEPSRP